MAMCCNSSVPYDIVKVPEAFSNVTKAEHRKGIMLLSNVTLQYCGANNL